MLASILIITAQNGATAGEIRATAVAPVSESYRAAELPRVLPAGEAARYVRIFALQERHAWGEADREIARLKDRLLVGHVLAQRYLAAGYRSSYGELADWLNRYADEPDARAIFGLAERRKPRGAKLPPRPEPPSAEPTDPEAALRLGAIARADRAAGARSARTAGGETSSAALARWYAGLAAWRRDDMGEARADFEALAQRPGPSPWLRPAASFWAARVALRTHRPDQVAAWLGIAAAEPRSFYGLIARRLLGTDATLDFAAEPFTALDARIIAGLAAGRRALALLEIEERPRAVAELRALAAANNPALLPALVGLADRANLPALSLRLAGAIADADGQSHDRGFYPVPGWRPDGGFTVDRALLFALMRQESLFVPNVTSSSGAAGLMQLMPATARELAQRNGVSLGRDGYEAEARRALANPALNLTLAQDYVRVLLGDERVKGNLVLFAIAYNRGPNAAQRWQGLADQYRHDPLLYIESIPSAQGRVFTKHVLANYWIYRQRLGQPTRDLDALAGGQWPTYTAHDRKPDEGGLYAANR